MEGTGYDETLSPEFSKPCFVTWFCGFQLVSEECRRRSAKRTSCQDLEKVVLRTRNTVQKNSAHPGRGDLYTMVGPFVRNSIRPGSAISLQALRFLTNRWV